MFFFERKRGVPCICGYLDFLDHKLGMRLDLGKGMWPSHRLTDDGRP